MNEPRSWSGSHSRPYSGFRLHLRCWDTLQLAPTSLLTTSRDLLQPIPLFSNPLDSFPSFS